MKNISNSGNNKTASFDDRCNVSMTLLGRFHSCWKCNRTELFVNNRKCTFDHRSPCHLQSNSFKVQLCDFLPEKTEPSQYN